ncbi:hypothetical protein LJC58_02900 [Lachnospiraceae bacterium OttesenSCG-928-D06]|nr:hypothetical protein [Lachnospiraceae bacterium OttesenSCG-928-D06]
MKLFHKGHPPKGNLTGQFKGILLILLLVLAIYIVGSIQLLNRVRTQALQEMEEMSRLYTDELDNRFFRISRRLFSTVMENGRNDTLFGKYTNILQNDEINRSYAVGQLREYSLSYTWEYGSEYKFFYLLKR